MRSQIPFKVWTLDNWPLCSVGLGMVRDFFARAAEAVGSVSHGNSLNARDGFNAEFAKVIQHAATCPTCTKLREQTMEK